MTNAGGERNGYWFGGKLIVADLGASSKPEARVSLENCIVGSCHLATASRRGDLRYSEGSG